MTETFDSLATEGRDAALADLDLMSTLDLVLLMNDRDAAVAPAVREAASDIAALVDGVAGRLAAGGRLVYVGAGSAGRLGQLDAAECPPTFGLDEGVVVAVLAGGRAASARAAEQAEDDAAAGAADLAGLGVGPGDAVVAVSASGRTPYAVAALEHAAAVGAFTGAVVCNTGTPMSQLADVTVAVRTGPELLAGSTRLTAGTAQKMVLNMVSTLAMVRIGRTFGNLMVDVVASNEKLRRRAERIVAQATGCPDAEAAEALAAADGHVRTAILTVLTGLPVSTARELADRHRHLRACLVSLEESSALHPGSPSSRPSAGAGATPPAPPPAS